MFVSLFEKPGLRASSNNSVDDTTVPANLGNGIPQKKHSHTLLPFSLEDSHLPTGTRRVGGVNVFQNEKGFQTALSTEKWTPS